MEKLPDIIILDGKKYPTKNNERKYIAESIPEIINFWKWFGNSIIKDSLGRPIILYHGTDTIFNVFSKTSDIGYHFGTLKTAKSRNYDLVYFYERNKKSLVILPVYLKAKKLVKVDDGGTWDSLSLAWELVGANLISEKDVDNFSQKSYDEIKKFLKNKDYEGIVYDNQMEGGGNSYVVFDSNQIKSTKNVGNFDSNNLDIYL